MIMMIVTVMKKMNEVVMIGDGNAEDDDLRDWIYVIFVDRQEYNYCIYYLLSFFCII